MSDAELAASVEEFTEDGDKCGAGRGSETTGAAARNSRPTSSGVTVPPPEGRMYCGCGSQFDHTCTCSDDYLRNGPPEGQPPAEWFATGMREHEPGFCWRLLPGERVCIKERGHDGGAHEREVAEGQPTAETLAQTIREGLCALRAADVVQADARRELAALDSLLALVATLTAELEEYGALTFHDIRDAERARDAALEASAEHEAAATEFCAAADKAEREAATLREAAQALYDRLQADDDPAWDSPSELDALAAALAAAAAPTDEPGPT